MTISRRVFAAGALSACTTTESQPPLYGLLGKMSAHPGQREALIAILLEGARAMPGCLSYIVAEDTRDDVSVWVTEVWDSAASHQAALQLPQVQTAIERGRPLIADFGTQLETVPRGATASCASNLCFPWDLR